MRGASPPPNRAQHSLRGRAADRPVRSPAPGWNPLPRRRARYPLVRAAPCTATETLHDGATGSPFSGPISHPVRQATGFGIATHLDDVGIPYSALASGQARRTVSSCSTGGPRGVAPSSNRRGMMKVKNINGTSDNSCNCGSWLAHWKNYSGQLLSQWCAEANCINQPEVGAHVQKDSRDAAWYIVPLCREHNSKRGATLDLVPAAVLVSANVANTCG